jgi:hypothetical protein
MSSFILDRINSRDIFDDNGDIVNEKLFIAFYNEIPQFFRLKKSMNTEQCVEALKERYKINHGSPQNRKFESYYQDTDHDSLIPFVHTRSGIFWTIFLKEKLLIEVSENKFEMYYSHSISSEEVESIKKIVYDHVITKSIEKSYFSMITSRAGDWDLSDFEIKQVDVNLEDHYNDDFIYYHDRILTSLQDKHQTGIIILHGFHGTGKTTYLRYLIGNTKLKFIYLPSYLANSISDPSLLPFLTEHTNSVLILEDCEQILIDREGGNTTAAITNILNMSDGLLGDALGIKIICTFNTSLNKIDKALTRKGRMIARYEFGELHREKAEKLAADYELKLDFDRPLTLANIFGNSKLNETMNDKRMIGFK